MSSPLLHGNPASVLALDHVAFGVPSIAAVCEPIARDLGGEPHHSGPGIGFRGAQWHLAGGGRIEVIEPDGLADGFLQRFLAVGGSRPHHLTFKVRDIGAAARASMAAGYTVVGFDDRLAGWKEMFLHPKQAQGIVVQLAESHPELDEGAWTDAWPFPRYPIVETARPRVVGFRLSARSWKRAEAQWGTLLGGEIAKAPGELRVSWPDSPLRISIRLDPSRRDGPLGLEVVGHNASARRLDALGCDILPADA
jgi:methylmalonyl-CoA/ethylmalonyl-CoA epimerase